MSASFTFAGWADVRGSDIKASRRWDLGKAGARFTWGMTPPGGGPELLVYSTAIPAHNPEIKAARSKQIPTWHRSKLLAVLLNERHGIAVAGTHGKTTTTAMLALLLARGGLDPTAVIGGEVSFFDGNARLGKSPYIVAEACESDHSFLRYRPLVSLLTNIEADHLEHYEGNFNKLVDTYLAFVNNVKGGGTVFYCKDDLLLNSLSTSFNPKSVSYGLSHDADVRGDGVKIEGFGSSFRLVLQGDFLGEIVLHVPGLYNIRNALGAAAVALHLGIDFPVIQEALSVFEGARRRFEIIVKLVKFLLLMTMPTTLRRSRRPSRRHAKAAEELSAFFSRTVLPA